MDYVDGFSDNVKEVFREIEFEESLDILVEYDLLPPSIKMVCLQELGDGDFSDYGSFMNLFEEFVHWMVMTSATMGMTIRNCSPKNSFINIKESLDEYEEFLNSLLLIDCYLTDYYAFNNYDPNLGGAYTQNKKGHFQNKSPCTYQLVWKIHQRLIQRALSCKNIRFKN